MKLKVYDKRNSCSISTGRPTVRISRKAGLLTFQKGAIALLGLLPGDRLIVCNDEDSPRDWYIHKTADPEAFAPKPKGKAGANIVQFNSSILAAKVLDSAGVAERASFAISKTPAIINGMEYWPLITANPIGAK